MLRRFTVVLLVTLVAFGVGLGFALTHFVKKNHLQRALEITAKISEREAAARLSVEDFKAPTPGRPDPAVDRKLRAFDFCPNVLSVTLWDAEGRILWSEDVSRVGKRFSHNDGLFRALRGERVVGEPPNGPLTERAADGGETLAVYVPVRLDPGGEVVGVMELHTDTSGLLEDLRTQNLILWGANAAGLAVFFFTLYGFMARASRRIDEQNEMLARSEARMKNLLRFANDGIVAMDGERRILMFNRSAERVFGMSESQALGTPFDRLLSPRCRTDVISTIDRLYRATGGDRGVSLQVDALRGGDAYLCDLSLSASGTGNERVVSAFVREAEAGTFTL